MSDDGRPAGDGGRCVDDGVRALRAGRRTVEVHRPDKVLFPAGADGREYTKGGLVAYYRSVAAFMLPQLRGRPLMLERHPDGVDGPRFMQKYTPERHPEWITRVATSSPRRTAPSCTPCATTWPPSSTSPTRPASPCTAGRLGPAGSTART
ncbi:hypothetical protein GCM10010350_05980 [Streptomyces galilaeus]|nr:hypothetical protein GCM10010350_05980 [Streptomyces galilaeus]